MSELTPLQKTQAAYAHFTLEEWRNLALCVRHYEATMHGTLEALNKEKVFAMLAKFPSAVL